MNPLKRLLAAFRGGDSGQSVVEYLIIVGICALCGIAGFTRYGAAVKSDLVADAKHIEGEGLPNTEGILSTIGADYNEVPGWCVKPNYCFAAGTPVQTESGDRAIDSVRVGDRIWARDVKTGAIALRPVVNTYRTAHVRVVDLVLTSSLVAAEHLSVTQNHLFWVEGSGWVRADELEAKPLWSTEAQVRANPSDVNEPSTTVYNLEVSEFHSYFVGHSHVLVHNGDQDGSSCPGGASGAAATSTKRKPVECGESGSYRVDLGGGGATAKQRRASIGMERDHIPSGAALAARAERLYDQLVDAAIADRCRDLRAPEREAVEAAVDRFKIASRESLGNAVKDAAFAVELPIPLHYDGRTRGYKNRIGMAPLPDGVYASVGTDWVKQYERDSEDLHAATLADIAAYERLLGLDGGPAEYTQELSAECRERIREALDKIRLTSDKEYEDELTKVARLNLSRSRKFRALLNAQKCKG